MQDDDWLTRWVQYNLNHLWTLYGRELPWNDAGPETSSEEQPQMHSHASSSGYETTTGENGETLYLVGDVYMTPSEAAEYAQAEADAVHALGDPGAYDGYPAAIAPVRPDKGTTSTCLHSPDDTHDPECCDHSETVNGICQDCGEQAGPIIVTMTLNGLPQECPHCGAPAPDGQWGIGDHGNLLHLVCPRCFTAIAPIRGVAG